MHARSLLGLALVALASAACTTTYGEGRRALSQGRYTEAVTHFEEVLEKQPERVDALVGIGVAKYRAGRYDEALEPLGRAVAREPKLAAARLYLGLTHLRRADIGPVEEHFKTLVAEWPGTRLAAQTQRALQLLRGPDAASDDVRAFMAASLENEYEAAREVAEAQRQARDAELRWRDPFPYYYGHPAYLRPRSRR